MVLSDPGWKRGWEVAEVREALSAGGIRVAS